MTYDPKSNSIQAAALMLCIEPKELSYRLNDSMSKTEWNPIETVPFNQDVICLWGTCTIGSSIFFSDHDVKHTYAKYWIPMPKTPTK